MLVGWRDQLRHAGSWLDLVAEALVEGHHLIVAFTDLQVDLVTTDRSKADLGFTNQRLRRFGCLADPDRLPNG